MHMCITMRGLLWTELDRVVGRGRVCLCGYICVSARAKFTLRLYNTLPIMDLLPTPAKKARNRWKSKVISTHYGLCKGAKANLGIYKVWIFIRLYVACINPDSQSSVIVCLYLTSWGSLCTDLVCIWYPSSLCQRVFEALLGMGERCLLFTRNWGEGGSC